MQNAAALLAVDPGANQGWAYFASVRRTLASDPVWTLRDCGLGAIPATLYVPIAVIEQPMIYPGGHERPNDLITLAISAGRTAGVLQTRHSACEVRWILPRAWKGTIAKEICTARIEARLAPEETAIVLRTGLPRSKVHDVLDAVGLGLFATGRARTGMV